MWTRQILLRLAHVFNVVEVQTIEDEEELNIKRMGEHDERSGMDKEKKKSYVLFCIWKKIQII